MTFPIDPKALTEMTARVAEEFLPRFADMGVTKITAIAGDPRIPDSENDPLGRRCTVALRTAPGEGDFIIVTDFWPEEVFRDTMEHLATHRHSLFKIRRLFDS